MRFYKPETYIFSSYKLKYNAGKFITNFFLPQDAGAFGNNIEK